MPTVRCNGAELYYESYGEGQPVVFLHGLWTGLRCFEPQLRELRADMRVIALDFRGHGRSEKTDAGHTVRQYAHDVHAFLEDRDLTDVVLVGWSMGAGVSWEYVDGYGTDRIQGLVNVDAERSPYASDGDAFGPEDIAAVSDRLVAIQTDHIADIERNLEAVLGDGSSRSVRTTLLDEESRVPPSVKSAIFADVLREPPDVLGDLDVPMLVCAGADQSFREVESVRAVADLVPEATFELFAESGHCITLEAPGRFNRVLRSFVDRVP